MADILLTNVLQTQISLEDLFKWLTADDSEEIITCDLVKHGKFTRREFISYFLNYLRAQSKSVLPEVEKTKEKVEKPGEPKVSNGKSKAQKEFPELANSIKNVSILDEEPETGKTVFANAAANFKSRKQQRLSSPEGEGANVSREMHFVSTSSPHNNPVHFGDATKPVRINCVPIANLDISSGSGPWNTSFSNASFDTSSPRRLDASLNNSPSVLHSATFSPMSPFSGNNERSHNHSRKNHENSSANVSRSSTPKNTNEARSNSTKLQKSAQFCLGDFVKDDESSGKKGSRKNPRRRASYRSEKSRNSCDDKTGKMEISGDEQSQNNQMKLTRRIKPTKLIVSACEENQNNEVFGVVSRPRVANPTFIEAPATDKSQVESFATERELLKLERQKQPKNEATIEPANNEVKLPSKTKTQCTITPRLDLVDDIETLEIMALLYSGIFDRHLMPDPTAELHFIMGFITAQYKISDEKESMKNNNIGENDGKFVSESTAESLDRLKDDLGCCPIPDDIITRVTDEDSTSSDTKIDDKSINTDTEDSFVTEHFVVEEKKTSVEDLQNSQEKYLNTVHNCVFFATTVLSKQRNLLRILDRATLKFLSANQQIETFQPELKKFLIDLYVAKCSQANRSNPSISRNAQNNVTFQEDTDNRQSFPTLSAFSSFRKQRDMFYEILKAWEENHVKPNARFTTRFQKKVEALFAENTESSNYFHIATLFVSQLLVSSGQSGATEDPTDDESLSLLKSFAHLNPEKLAQLKERLVTRSVSTGPVPRTAFPGVQTFYKEFILLTNDRNFHTFLENSLIHNIMELNEASFNRIEIEGTETMVDETTRQNFTSCITKLRLLAKFAGFTFSLPFKSINSGGWVDMSWQIQLRKHILPPLDIRSCLVNALTNKKLALTVPWIVQYMSMLDSAALRLPYFVFVGQLLYCIYRISSLCYVKENFSISPQTSILMMFTIGWLFGRPKFPCDLYAEWQANFDDKKLRIIDQALKHQHEFENSIVCDKSSGEFEKFNATLDKLEIIDDRALFECCPSLTDLKMSLFNSDNLPPAHSNTNRHITPVSTKLSQTNSDVKAKNLENQLEEAFLHGQPSSIRKMIDFVSEQVASSIVKHIHHDIIPATKQRIMKESFEKSPKKPSFEDLAARINAEVRRECAEKTSDLCKKKTIKTMDCLLDDVPSSVRQICTLIAKKMADERIEQWIASHVVPAQCIQEITSDVNTLEKREAQETKETSNAIHNPEASSPVESIANLRKMMWELLELKKRWFHLSVENIAKNLHSLRQTLTERSDLMSHTAAALYAMSVDFCLLLITHRPDLLTNEILDQLVSIWKIHAVSPDAEKGLFERVFNSRNIRLFSTAPSPRVINTFLQVLTKLLHENLLTETEVQAQMETFRPEWPTEIAGPMLDWLLRASVKI